MNSRYITHVLLAHSEPLFCKGLYHYLRRVKVFSFAYITIAALLPDLLKKQKWDVLVLDERLGKFTPHEWLTSLHKEYPAMKILLLAKQKCREQLNFFQQSGASGFVDPCTEGMEIKKGIDILVKGQDYICSVTAAKITNEKNAKHFNAEHPDPGLCKRLSEVLVCLLKKMTIKEMVEYFGLKESTIKEYRSEAKKKILKAGYKDIYDYARITGIEY